MEKKGERLTNTGSKGEIWITDNDTTRSLGRKEAAYRKLKEYEDLEEQKKLFIAPCAAGETVYDLALCDDGTYQIFPMRVCNVVPYGSIYDGKVWNVYLENKHTKAYRSFYDFGRTVFTDIDMAEEALADAEARAAVVHGM